MPLPAHLRYVGPPYEHTLPPERVLVPRTFPAKGARCALWFEGGRTSHIFGRQLLPAIVVQLTPEQFIVRDPRDVATQLTAYDLYDPTWNVVDATDLLFWFRCGTCLGSGDVLYDRGHICNDCGGRGSVKTIGCENCRGSGHIPGSELVLACEDCGGFGDRVYDPFVVGSTRHPPRQRKARKRS